MRNRERQDPNRTREDELKARFEADCEAVAHLVQPMGTPAWLTEYFQYWANPLGSEWSVALLQPPRAEMKDHLTSIVNAANSDNSILGASA
jgi:hypothetical protein